MTTPATAIRLAEMTANLPPSLRQLNRLDDIFVAGVAREHIEGFSVEQFSGGVLGDLWNRYFKKISSEIS